MSRDDRKAAFIAKWRGTVAGHMALAGDSVRKSLAGQCVTAEALGQAMLSIAQATDALLARLYDDAVPATPEPAELLKNGSKR